MAYILPGLICIATGLGYALFHFKYPRVVSAPEKAAPATAPQSAASQGTERRHAVRILAIIFTTTAIGGLIFQSTSFAMPKIIDERMSEFATNATLIGTYAFIVFAFASVAQLVVGYMLDNHSLRSIFIIVAASQVILFTLMRNMTGIAALLVAIGYMLVIFGQLPVNDVLVGRVASPAWRSRVYAIRYMVTFSVMATAVPFIAWIHAGWGFSRLFTILAFAAAGIFCLVLLLPGRASVMRAQEIPAE